VQATLFAGLGTTNHAPSLTISEAEFLRQYADPHRAAFMFEPDSPIVTFAKLEIYSGFPKFFTLGPSNLAITRNVQFVLTNASVSRGLKLKGTCFFTGASDFGNWTPAQRDLGRMLAVQDIQDEFIKSEVFRASLADSRLKSIAEQILNAQDRARSEKEPYPYWKFCRDVERLDSEAKKFHLTNFSTREFLRYSAETRSSGTFLRHYETSRELMWQWTFLEALAGVLLCVGAFLPFGRLLSVIITVVGMLLLHVWILFHWPHHLVTWEYFLPGATAVTVLGASAWAGFRKLGPRVTVLVTVNNNETQAVLDAFMGPANHAPLIDKAGVTYADLGTYAGMRIVQTTAEMGSGGLGASQQRVKDAIAHWRPNIIIAVGVAFGADETKQRIGDVLVAKQIQDYNLERINSDGTITPRGDKPACSDSLLNRIRQIDALKQRTDPDWPKLHFGLLLSGEKLVDNLDYREHLKNLHAEAIGGEMEGIGLYVSAYRQKVDWILVKGICDWGHEKNRGDKNINQRIAAKSAATVVKAALDVRSGG
jgi:nucleoside phosphorylase